MTSVSVGDRFVCVRSIHGTEDHRWEAVVVRVTPKRAYLSAIQWFALNDLKREVKPRYLEFRTFAIPKVKHEADKQWAFIESVNGKRTSNRCPKCGKKDVAETLNDERDGSQLCWCPEE